MTEITEIREKKKRLRPDWWLLIAVFLLVAIGVIMVFSSSQYFASYEPYNDSYYFLKAQIVNVTIGFVALICCFLAPIRLYKKLAYPVFLGVLGLLAFMLVYSGVETAGGAGRWLEIAGINFQPSELAKIALPLGMAKWISDHRDQIDDILKGFVVCLGAIFVVALLILLQKDLSSAVVVAVSGFIMMMCAGIKGRYLCFTVAAGVAVIIVAIIMQPYRLERVYAVLDPWAYASDEGWQICQSLMALGSGGLTGVGLGDGGSKWFYLPERHTDFIFSIIGEELGFLGAVFVILLIVFIVWRGILIAIKAPDMFCTMLALGIICSIAVQSLINLCVVTGLMPVTGVTLPFVSYGGTSMIVCMSIVGILLKISCYCRR